MKYQRGDVAIFFVFMITSILVLLLGTLSQRVADQIQRNRQGLASQQAAQAAQTGLEHWIEELKVTGSPSGASSKVGNGWVDLNTSAVGVDIQYKVTYDDNTGNSDPNILTAIGRADTTNSDTPVRRIVVLEL